MKKTYPLMKAETYELSTHEGVKRVNVWQKEKDLELEVEDTAVSQNTSYEEPKNLHFEGIAQIPVAVGPQVFSQEIRFEIDANSVEEAFNNFNTSANNYIKKLQKQQDNNIQEQQSEIVTPEDLMT